MNAAVYQLIHDIRKLPTDTQLRLAACIIESVAQASSGKSNFTSQHSEFRCPNLETDEEVKVAQWHLEGQVADTK